MPQEDPAEVARDVGRRVAEIRTGLGLTQEQAAERIGLSPKAWQRIEQGTRDMKVGTLVRVASALGVRVADLFAAPASREVRKGRPRTRKAPP